MAVDYSPATYPFIVHTSFQFELIPFVSFDLGVSPSGRRGRAAPGYAVAPVPRRDFPCVSLTQKTEEGVLPPPRQDFPTATSPVSPSFTQ